MRLIEEQLEKALTAAIKAKAILFLKDKTTAQPMLEWVFETASKYEMDEAEAKRMLGLDKEGA